MALEYWVWGNSLESPAIEPSSPPLRESNSGLDAEDTETSPDAEGSGYFVSREPGSFGSPTQLLKQNSSIFL